MVQLAYLIYATWLVVCSIKEAGMSSVTDSTIQRRRILVQGIVQGVGFRPFVYGQAQRWSLVGSVLNDSRGVTIEVEGNVDALDHFQQALSQQAPPLARIDAMATELIPLCHEHSFMITHSQHGAERQVLISPDSAICDDCLHELFDPDDRRYHYPFINCTNCGPRFTIIQDVPYDRDKTTMRAFPMCRACKSEYNDPLNRRFHAQPNACPLCGPQVSLLDWHTNNVYSALPMISDPMMAAAQSLMYGAIIAIKGLGGYHLACNALNMEAVQRLRLRKRREAKPFALMVPDIKTARLLCNVNAAEATLLQSYHRPIVLLEKRPDCPVAPDVAMSYSSLGIMLPYAPLHYVLLHTLASVVGPSQPTVLVMTSGNLSDEPIAYRDDDAQQRLAAIAEGMLTHNRTIHMRCDDSVMRIVAGGEQIFRRARGYAPEPILLSSDLPTSLLACGGHLKNTFCLGKGRQAFVSQHIGDLENLETLTSFHEGIDHFQRLFDIYPQAIAYDLHPEYLATKYALDSDILQKIGVQHHHAHIASVLAEHGLSGQIIGIAADGTGFGTDGAVWGCEIMQADCIDFERLAHLRYVPLPGGEQAVHQPWRMAAAYLAQAYGSAFLELDIPFVRRLDRSKWRMLSQMIARGINSPPTSSLGRLFDAVAALLGLHDTVLYEGQAAIELEIVAAKDVQVDPYPFTVQRSAHTPAILDVAPMIRAIVGDIQQGLPVSQIASRFHYSIAELLAVIASDVRVLTGLNDVALSGGVFQNRLLLETLMQRLKAMDFQVYINRRVPPNDGGLSLGQLAVAAARLQKM
jgi:hydrogenase maturation protein HypF